MSFIVSTTALGSAGRDRTCAALFSVPTRWQIRHVRQWRPALPRILSDFELREIFSEIETGSSAGRAALKFMAKLPRHFTSHQKAQIWVELTTAIVRVKSLAFLSDMYLLPRERYLFRGGLGETLFIDNDGALYRLKTSSLLDLESIVMDQSVLTRIDL